MNEMGRIVMIFVLVVAVVFGAVSNLGATTLEIPAVSGEAIDGLEPEIPDGKGDSAHVQDRAGTIDLRLLLSKDVDPDDRKEERGLFDFDLGLSL